MYQINILYTLYNVVCEIYFNKNLLEKSKNKQKSKNQFLIPLSPFSIKALVYRCILSTNY